MSAKRMLWQGCGYRLGDSLAAKTKRMPPKHPHRSRARWNTKFSTPNVVFGIITMNLGQAHAGFMERPKIIA